MKALQSLETLGTALPTAHCHIPEELNLQHNHCENLTSHNLAVFNAGAGTEQL
jgi:hypothetical protein